MATSTSRVHALPTPAFVLARVFAAHVAGVAAYVRKQQRYELRSGIARLLLVRDCGTEASSCSSSGATAFDGRCGCCLRQQQSGAALPDPPVPAESCGATRFMGSPAELTSTNVRSSPGIARGSW
jgi:hypothetical protein